MAILAAFLNQKAKGILQTIFAAGLLFAAGSNASAQAEPSREYQIKAVFLFNFAEFVDWPADTFSNAQSPVVIGVLGDNPFGNYLDETVRGEKFNGHPLTVQHFRNVSDIKNCHLLFISKSEARNLNSIFHELKAREILTVSDIDHFAEDGGDVEFTTVQNKIHFEVNLEAAKNARLTISSKMLRLAKIVGTRKE